MTTTTDLITEVINISRQMPDFVYKDKVGLGCSYFGQGIGDTTGQCCIIGQAFKNLNVDTSGIEEVKNTGKTITTVLRNKDVPIEIVDSTHVTWLARVQDAQDKGRNWRKAVNIAERLATSIGGKHV